MGGYCASGTLFVLVVVSWPGLLKKKIDNLNVIVNIIGQINECLNVIVNIIGQINECLSSEFWTTLCWFSPVSATYVIHLYLHTYNTPKTQYMYYKCSTTGHVSFRILLNKQG